MTHKEDVMKIFKKLPEKVIPYRKELVAIVGSVKAAILWQQLEYWFDKMKKQGLYKFLSPLEEEKYGYREGDSWTEELGFSECEFRSAFSKMGVAYKSKREFMENEEDVFQGRMYCSYIDKIGRRTYYYRNTEMVKLNLQRLEKSLYGPANKVPIDKSICDVETSENEISTKSDNPIPINTENTAENTQENTQEIISKDPLPEASSGSNSEEKNKKKEKNSEERRNTTRRKLTDFEELLVFWFYRKYIYPDADIKTRSIVVGIRNALDLFEKKRGDSFILLATIKEIWVSDFFELVTPEEKLRATPKRFWSQEFLKKKLLPIALKIGRMKTKEFKRILTYNEANKELDDMYREFKITEGEYFRRNSGSRY
ncbi:hypothetical protein HOF67_02035 [Candidatus Peregrinibacteria bacterium]|jgi:hypothetical protein|nr:hypothetical protein [Candidatus Peregrinibacteria bacterium]